MFSVRFRPVAFVLVFTAFMLSSSKAVILSKEASARSSSTSGMRETWLFRTDRVKATADRKIQLSLFKGFTRRLPRIGLNPTDYQSQGGNSHSRIIKSTLKSSIRLRLQTPFNTRRCERNGRRCRSSALPRRRINFSP
eukprot:IDg2255t1